MAGQRAAEPLQPRNQPEAPSPIRMPPRARRHLGQFRVFPGARDRCRSNWVLFPRPLDEITVVVEHEHDSVRAEAPHGVDVVCGQLMGTFAGDQKRCAGPDRQVRCRKRPGWPSRSIPTKPTPPPSRRRQESSAAIPDLCFRSRERPCLPLAGTRHNGDRARPS